MYKKILVFFSLLLVSGCITTSHNYDEPQKPKVWTTHQSEMLQEKEVQDLVNWWLNFDDATLKTLIDQTLQDSPDRLIAESRILEARGLKRTARSFFFPQVGFSGNVNRQDFGFAGPDDFFDAGFDASYEIDLFGQVRNSNKAADEQVSSLEAEYRDVTLTLLADVTRTYIEYRANQKQAFIAQKNLSLQTKTLDLIRRQKELGEAPQLDVERAESLVNTTQASIPEFQRRATNAQLRLSVLTGQLPKDVEITLQSPADIPGVSLDPVLLSPADVLSLRPDVRAAAAMLRANSALSDAAFAELFPSFTLSGLFGYSEGAFSGTNAVWNITLGTAVALLDFGRIEGAIDVAKALEKRAYEKYRRTILIAVTEVESALNDGARINEQRAALQKAYNNANAALELSEILYKEGEISFLDVLDSQRTVNDAESALITAEAAQSESLVRLYKSLGVY